MTPAAPRPFEFLADARAVRSGPELRDVARRAEATGYAGLVIPDHLIPQLGPIAAMTWIAAATERLRVAAFVLNNDLRHPAVLAQELATIDVLSGGRLDVAIGAGWNRPEYEAIGIPFDRTPVRQARLAEAIAVLKGAFADGPFDFAGEHYRIAAFDGQPVPVQRPHPPFLIGGGGRRTLELAAREAQIVGWAPRIQPSGRGDPRSITLAASEEKVAWVREAAGERFAGLRLNTYPSMSGPELTDDGVARLRDLSAAIGSRTGLPISVEELAESPHILVGSVASLADKLAMLRERLGITSIMVGEVGEMDPLVERLAGS
jgi:probable F420-dependent oxidoreductase